MIHRRATSQHLPKGWNMNRRSFMAGILAACTAPAIVRASSLMRLPSVIVPEWCGVQTITGAMALSMDALGARGWIPTPSYPSAVNLNEAWLHRVHSDGTRMKLRVRKA